MKKKPRVRCGDNGFEEWGGYMSAKKAKLEEQFLRKANYEVTKNDGTSQLFSGVSVFVNGYTVPTADEIKRIMMLHGGLYHHYEREKTTYIIATNLPDTKVKRLKKHKIVKPQWIVDCLKAGQLLDHYPYLLYSNQSEQQPCLQFASTSTADAEISINGSENKEISCSTLAVPLSNHDRKLDSSSAVAVDQHVFVPESSRDRGGRDVAVSASHRADTYKRPETRTAVEPSFINEFYSNSRLHHISTMGATFKEYVCQLRGSNNGEFPGRQRLGEWKKSKCHKEDNVDYLLNDDLCDDAAQTDSEQKIIMHIDMDCFFVSVGVRNRPELKGLPVAVTHAKGNPNPSYKRSGTNRQFEIDYYRQKKKINTKGAFNTDNGGSDEDEYYSRYDDISESDSMAEIASCNYEARKYGLKNGMLLGSALKLCPKLKTISYDFEDYTKVSYMLYNTVASYTLEIEAVSCDEMYVNCTEVLKKTEASVLEFATFLRQEIKSMTGCPASTGFGANPLQARLATKKAKPDGQFHLLPEMVEEFMLSIKVEDLPGVGYTLATRLHSKGINTCGEMQKCTLGQLKKMFGNKSSDSLYKHCRGKDDRPLVLSHQRKSVSAEVNYGIRFTTNDEAEAFLRRLTGEVQTRLSNVGMKGRCITLKLMVRAKGAPVETAKFMGHGACDNVTRSCTLMKATADAEIIAREILGLSRALSIPPSDLRGIGIQISRLQSSDNSPETIVDFFSKKVRQPKIGNVKSSRDNTMTSQKIETTAQPAGNVTTTVKHIVEQVTVKEKKQPRPGTSHAEVLPKAMQTEVPNLSLCQVRELLREWVKSETEPRHCDISMLAEYAQQVVVDRHIAGLMTLLKQLFRCVKRRDSIKWQDAYLYIVNKTQETMLTVYGAKLKTYENF